MARDASDLRTLVDAERIKANKERLNAARKLANKQRESSATSERIKKLVRAQERRTGAKLLGKLAPKKVRRGKNFAAKPTGGGKTVIQKKPTALINVLSGSEIREKVRRATE